MSKKQNSNHIMLIAAWGVHLFTAIGAFLGVMTLYYIYHNEYILAFWMMGGTVFIDAIDGTLARKAHVKTLIPQFDGALLDNIIDFLNYVITPCFFLLVHPTLLPSSIGFILVAIISLTSAYQFCQADAKTSDHFFKGFPCYWNFVLFYMFITNASPMTNVLVLIICAILIFVPIKYVYPSRLDYFTSIKPLKVFMHAFAGLYGVSLGMMLWQYPNIEPQWITLSWSYILVYFAGSIYRTYRPMIHLTPSNQRT